MVHRDFRASMVFVFVVVLATAQSVQHPSYFSTAKNILIENKSGDSSVLDCAHLILASTRLEWTDNREKADLILVFDRRASQGDRSVNGGAISIAIDNFYTLNVTDGGGKLLWKDSVKFDPSANVRADRSERSWIEYLHNHPAAKLMANFLKLTK